MKKLLSMLAVVFTLGLSTVAMDAEAAKRMGSGKSLGTQRQATPDKAPTTTTAATPAAAAAPAAAAPSRSWMGPVAGLAAGLGLAALASHLGFGEELASMLMIGLLAVAVMVAIGFFMRKRAAAQQQGATRAGGMQYSPAGAGAAGQPVPAYEVAMPGGSGTAIASAIGADASRSRQIPADFDVAGFERHAKVNFIRLQAAHDAGNVDDIREFTTPEMFAELKMEMAERGQSSQKNEVVSINAEVIEVDDDTQRYLVSGEPDEAFDEIWHLMKPRQGSQGWALAGIQQR